MSADNFFLQRMVSILEAIQAQFFDFRNVLLQLMEPESTVLAIPDKDLTPISFEAPVRAGEEMYRDLQWKYFTAVRMRAQYSCSNVCDTVT